MYTKWLIITVLALGVGIHHIPPAHAQSQGSIEHKKKIEAEQDSKKVALFLNITPEQAKKIQAVRDRYSEGLTTLKENRTLSGDQVKQGIQSLREKAEASVGQILSLDQLKMLKMHGGPGILLGYANPTNPLDMIFKLDLTPQQVEQAKRMIGDLHQALDSIKQDGTLTPDQIKVRVEDIHMQAMHQLHALLTPEQMIKLHKIMGFDHDGNGGKTIPPTN